MPFAHSLFPDIKMTSLPRFDKTDTCLSIEFSISVLGAAFPIISTVGFLTNFVSFEMAERTSVSVVSHVLPVTKIDCSIS
ncbi:hypothetical protein ACU8V7_22995 [Zobellia nedashkovskayae]